MKRFFLVLCIAAGLLTACEKDPDMGELDVNLVVYTDHDNNTNFSSFSTYLN